ncbi:MAG: pyruvate kinase [Phycisphaerae bacterium]
MIDCVRTKTVITMGPACATAEVFSQLVQTGVSVVRLNFSHGDLAQRAEFLAVARSGSHHPPLAIMGDLCGPKIRLGKVTEGGIAVGKGDVIAIQRAPILGQNKLLSSNYPGLVDDVRVGQSILIDDGYIRATVIAKETDIVRCRIVAGGTIQSNKGINLPHTRLSIPSITENDWRDIDWAIEHQLDYLALSFVRCAEDVQSVRRYLESKKSDIDLVAKIEMPQAIDDLSAILDSSDAVLVARGDMGVEMELTSVPLLQKNIVDAAHAAGKPVIVATQMLQSMVDNPTPTRAEVSDVANAILDGADAVMLSGETAVGKYPLEAVQTLRDIADKTERYIVQKGIHTAPPRLLQISHHRTAALAHGAMAIAGDINARMVVVWSQAGGAARFLSKNRFSIPIVAMSTDQAAVRRMALYYGVTPIQARIPAHFDDLPAMVDDLLQCQNWAKPGDRVVIAAGAPLGIAGATNSLSVYTVGEPGRTCSERP